MYKKRLILDVFTSDFNITKKEFEVKVRSRALNAEIDLNRVGDLRWHVKEGRVPTRRRKRSKDATNVHGGPR